MAVLGRCTKLSALTVARRQKSPSSQQKADQSTVETATKSTGVINGVLEPDTASGSAGSLIRRTEGFSEAPDVAAGKYAVLACAQRIPEVNLYLNSKADQYVPGRALYLFSKWLGRQAGWKPPAGTTVLGYALYPSTGVGRSMISTSLALLLENRWRNLTRLPCRPYLL